MNHSTNPLRRIFRVLAWHEKLLPMLAGCMLISWVAVAAVVSMQRPPNGGELHIPVMLYGDGDESLSGLQFDFNYDITAFELVAVSSGGAASDAGKEVILTETVPGEGRVLITGFNNTELFDGHVATVILRPLQSDGATHDISIDRVLASDPDGNTVPIGYEDLFQYPPAAPEKTEPSEDTPETPELLTSEPDVESTGTSGEAAEVDGTVSTTEAAADSTGGTSTNAATGTSALEPARAASEAHTPSARQDTPQPRAPDRTSYTPGALRSSEIAQRSNVATASDRSTSGTSRPQASSPTHSIASRRSGSPEAPQGTEGAPLNELDTPRRLALAAPMADAFAHDRAAMAIGANNTAVEPSPRAWRTPQFAAAALGPLVLAAMLLIRSLLFGRRARPTWRRPR